MGKKGAKFWSFKALDDKTGELVIYTEISNATWWGDEVTPKQFKADLDALGDIDILNIYINSPGGDCFASQAIYSMLNRHKAYKNVYIDGLAASGASLIAMVGDKIIMPANAMMMIHLPWTIGIGYADDFRKLADDMDKIRDSMVVVYESRSALTTEEVIEIMKAETWLLAEECLEYGFADEVVEAKRVAACLDEKHFARYKNVPKELLKSPEADEEVKARELLKRKLELELEL